MTKTKQVELVQEPEAEEYLKYIIKDCTFNITVETGGQVIFQTGKPTPPPPPPHGGQ